MRWRLSLALAAVLAAHPALAEESLVTLHAQPGALIDFKNGAALFGGVFKLDTTALGLGPIAPQIQFFAMGGSTRSVLVDGALLGGGIGVRLRLLNDESGFAFGTKGVKGSVLSNLFIEAHLDYEHGGFGLGADVGVGLELSLYDGLLVAPTAKMFFNSFTDRFEPTLMLGLEFSFGIPYNPGKETDGDGDGLKAKDDKCPAEAEDKDGFEDSDGCPDPDNDKDDVPDEKDKCPNVPGMKTGKPDDTGCPLGTEPAKAVVPDAAKVEVPDADKDGVPDADDLCPAVVGPASNHGCPLL